MSEPNDNHDIVNDRIRRAGGRGKAGSDPRQADINEMIRAGFGHRINTGSVQDPEAEIDKELAAAIAREIKEGRQ